MPAFIQAISKTKKDTDDNMPRLNLKEFFTTGTMDEPLLRKRSDDKSAAGQPECAKMACITAGTSRLVLGRQAATSASQAPGSKRACRRTAAPVASAGSTWMHSPPTWNSSVPAQMIAKYSRRRAVG